MKPILHRRTTLHAGPTLGVAVNGAQIRDRTSSDKAAAKQKPQAQRNGKLPGAALRDKWMSMATIGQGSSEARSLREMPASIPATGVDALFQHVLSDPQLSQRVGKAMAKVSSGDFAKASHSEADRALRLRLLVLSKEPRLRRVLMAAVRTELLDNARRLRRALGTAPPDKPLFVPLLTIGGGPVGQAIANALHQNGVGSGHLVVDASDCGDGNFGSVREHLLNSRTQHGYKGDSIEALNRQGGTHHPLVGSPIQPDDWNDDPRYPTAGELGDASSLGLYAAARRGTAVMVGTKVTAVSPAPPGAPGKFLVEMKDREGGTYRVRTDRIVDATGAGVPKLGLARDHPEFERSREYVAKQSERIRIGGRAVLATQSVAHSEDFLRATVDASPGEILSFVRDSPGDIAVVGWGDSARTPIMRLMDAAKKEGTSLKKVLGDRKLVVYGASAPAKFSWAVSGPYAPLRKLCENGVIRFVPHKLAALVPRENGQSALFLQAPDGQKPEADPALKEALAGRILLAMGMQRHNDEIFAPLDPEGRIERDAALEGRADRLRTSEGPLDIHSIGMASTKAFEQRQTQLWYASAATRQLADRVLAPSLQNREEASSLERALEGM